MRKIGRIASWVVGIALAIAHPTSCVAVRPATSRARTTRSAVTICPNQPHAFVKDAEGIKSFPAQGAAWAEMLGFFDGALRAPATQSRAQGVATGVAGDFYGWMPVLRLALGHSGHGHGSPWDSGMH